MPMGTNGIPLSLTSNRGFKSLSLVILLIASIPLSVKESASQTQLNLHIDISNESRLRTKLHVKKEDFNFLIVKISFICSNSPSTPVYGVNIYQLIQYSRGCASYHYFL